MSTKRAFQVPTSFHPNAVSGQAYEAKEWLNYVLAEIAKEQSNLNNPTMQGPTVTVVIEVLI